MCVCVCVCVCVCAVLVIIYLNDLLISSTLKFECENLLQFSNRTSHSAFTESLEQCRFYSNFRFFNMAAAVILFYRIDIFLSYPRAYDGQSIFMNNYSRC